MIGKILAALAAPRAEIANEAEDARLAMAALMVRLARSDGDYAMQEAEVIDAALAERYALAPAASKSLRERAEEIEASAPDTVRFTRAVKDAVPYEDRFAEVVSLWRVVLADGSRACEEDGLMRLVVNLLGVSDRDSAIARRQATERSRPER